MNCTCTRLQLYINRSNCIVWVGVFCVCVRARVCVLLGGPPQEFHSEKLKDDLPDEEVVGEGEENEPPCGDDY